MVDEPSLFGMIAAANSLSDVYAMGGRPLLAMNIVTFPIKEMDRGILRDILAGGLVKIREAGALLVGGHSVEDQEMKYGLSVTGTAHPDRIVKNSGAAPGDVVLLTKPIGTGIISTAIKGGLADSGVADAAIECMSTLNMIPGRIMADAMVSACTDITGFGLIGHLHEIAIASGVMVEIEIGSLPFLEGVEELVNTGMVPEGAYANRKFYTPWVDCQVAHDLPGLVALYDPQTSGGLLITCPEDRAEVIIIKVAESDYPFSCHIVGRVEDAPADMRGRIRVV
jgi:selenide,water dikinase